MLRRFHAFLSYDLSEGEEPIIWRLLTSLPISTQEEVEAIIRYYLCRWEIESGLHMALDVVFDEDKHRYQDKIGAANLSLLRKVALAILTRDTTLKCEKPAKQMRAATSSTYRDHLLKNCF